MLVLRGTDGGLASVHVVQSFDKLFSCESAYGGGSLNRSASVGEAGSRDIVLVLHVVDVLARDNMPSPNFGCCSEGCSNSGSPLCSRSSRQGDGLCLGVDFSDEQMLEEMLWRLLCWPASALAIWRCEVDESKGVVKGELWKTLDGRLTKTADCGDG